MKVEEKVEESAAETVEDKPVAAKEESEAAEPEAVEEVQTEAQPETEAETEVKKGDPVIEAKAETLKGLKVLGKIELPKPAEKPVASSDDSKDKKKKI